MTTPTHIISLGAGVQSSTMALMAAHGEITPMPTAAIFADTQAEPQSVYKWLDWLETQLPFPVHRVTNGSLNIVATTVRISRDANVYTKGAVPAFIRDEETGKVGLLNRQCTSQFKIAVIERKANEMLRPSLQGVQWLGISTDEAHRMKESRRENVENRWPLIELGMSRNDCLDWMERKGYPRPPRSSCVFCPYHNDREWLDLKVNDPDSFLEAVVFERRFAKAVSLTRTKPGGTFLHRSCVPLDQIDFSNPDENQPSLFGNECEGVCGV